MIKKINFKRQSGAAMVEYVVVLLGTYLIWENIDFILFNFQTFFGAFMTTLALPL